MTLTNAQIRAMFAKEDSGLKAKGTLPLKMTMASTDPRAKYDIERLKGTDKIVVRQKGKHTGVITTREDLGRVLRHIEKQKRITPSGSEIII